MAERQVKQVAPSGGHRNGLSPAGQETGGKAASPAGEGMETSTVSVSGGEPKPSGASLAPRRQRRRLYEGEGEGRFGLIMDKRLLRAVDHASYRLGIHNSQFIEAAVLQMLQRSPFRFDWIQGLEVLEVCRFDSSPEG